MKLALLIEKISSNRDEEYLQIIIEETSYILKNRRKGDKLSHDQINFFKVLSKDSSISTNEIWKAYSVSLSVLRKNNENNWWRN